MIEEAGQEFIKPKRSKNIYKFVAALSSIVIVIFMIMGTVVVAEVHKSNENKINYDGLASYPYTGGVIETSTLGTKGWGNKVHYYYEDVLYWPERENIWELPEDAEYVDTVYVYKSIHGKVEAYIYKSESNPDKLYWKWNLIAIKDSDYDKHWDKIWPLYKTEETRSEEN